MSRLSWAHCRTLHGGVVSLDGQPLAGVEVQLCVQPCRVTTTDALGRFDFAAVDPAGASALHARLPGASDYAELTLPLEDDLASAFHRAHEELYGFADRDREIELVAVRTAEVRRGPAPASDRPPGPTPGCRAGRGSG